MSLTGNPPTRALVLIGFMGAGKSRAAQALAAARGGKALDSDALLEESFGHSIAQEFELRGEAAFRAKEEELVCRLLADVTPCRVIALGGGAVLSQRVRAGRSHDGARGRRPRDGMGAGARRRASPGARA
jgi:shikimate kinase